MANSMPIFVPFLSGRSPMCQAISTVYPIVRPLASVRGAAADE